MLASPLSIARAARKSTWIGPCTAAIRWSTMRTTPGIAPRMSVDVVCLVPKNNRPQHGKISRSDRGPDVRRSLKPKAKSAWSRASSSVKGGLVLTGAVIANRARSAPSWVPSATSCARSTRIGCGGGPQSGHG